MTPAVPQQEIPAAKPLLPGSLNANRRLSQWVQFHADKRVTIHPGKVEIGQGILTALAQISADELDVAFERVEVKAASTDESPNEGVTSGSRSVVESGMALRHACAAIKEIFVSVIAQRTGVSIEQIRVVDGAFIGPGGEIGSYWLNSNEGLLECEAPGKGDAEEGRRARRFGIGDRADRPAGQGLRRAALHSRSAFARHEIRPGDPAFLARRAPRLGARSAAGNQSGGERKFRRRRCRQ